MFFFFQAEDGIRDDLVTGVQTCALPISICGIATEHGHPRLRRVLESRPFSIRKSNRDRRRAGYGVATGTGRASRLLQQSARSEERRVGKECRSRWTTDE